MFPQGYPQAGNAVFCNINVLAERYKGLSRNFKFRFAKSSSGGTSYEYGGTG